MRDGPECRFVNRDGFKNAGPLLALTVKDTGPGITPENMKRIFSESFTTQATGKGTGLGLSIVHRLVSRANGAIHASTKLGEGTSFTIYLPTCNDR
jgi:signal transduction histidine kinase